MRLLSITIIMLLTHSCIKTEKNDLEEYLITKLDCDNQNQVVLIAHENTCSTCFRKILSEIKSNPNVVYISDYNQMSSLLAHGLNDKDIVFENSRALNKLLKHSAVLTYNCSEKKVKNISLVTPNTMSDCLKIIKSP